MESGMYNLTGNDVRFTQTDKAVYIIGFGKPADNLLRLRTLRQGGPLGEITSAQMLGVEGDIAFTRDEMGMTLTLPAEHPFQEGFVIRLNKA